MNGTNNTDDLTLLEPEEILEKINTCRKKKVVYYKNLIKNCSVFKEALQNSDSSNIIDEHTTSETLKSRNLTKKSMKNDGQHLDSQHKLYLDSTEAMARAPGDNVNTTCKRKIMKSKNKNLDAPTHVSTECRKKHLTRKVKKSKNKDTEVPAEAYNSSCQPKAIKSLNKGAKPKITKSSIKSIRKLIHNLSNYKMLKARFEKEYNETHKSSNNTSYCHIRDKEKADSEKILATAQLGDYYVTHNEQKIEIEKKIEIIEAKDLDEVPCCSKSIRKTASTAPPYTSPPNNMETDVKSNNHRKIKRDILVEKIDKLLKPYGTDPTDERITPEFQEVNIKRYNDDCKFIYYFKKYCCPKERHHNVSCTALNHCKIDHYYNVKKGSSSVLSKSVKELISIFESRDECKKNQVPLPSNNYLITRNSHHIFNSSNEASQASEASQPSGGNQNKLSNIPEEINSRVPTHFPDLLKNKQKPIVISESQHNLSSKNSIKMGKPNSTSKFCENKCVRRTKGWRDVPWVTKCCPQPSKMPKLVFFKELSDEEDVNSLHKAPYCDQSQRLQNTMTVYMCNCDMQGNTTNQINKSEDISQENVMCKPLHSIESVKSAEEEHLLLLQKDLKRSFKHQTSETQCFEKCCNQKVHSSAKNSETYLDDLKEEFDFDMPSTNENLNENSFCTPKKEAENVSTSPAAKKHFPKRRPVFLPPSSSHSARTPSSSSHFLSSELSYYRFPRRVHYSGSSLLTMSSSLVFSTCTSDTSLYANSHTTSSTSVSSHSIATLDENDNNNLIVSQYAVPNDELEKSNSTFESPAPCNFIVTTEISFNPLRIYLPQHFLGGVVYFYPRIKGLIRIK